MDFAEQNQITPERVLEHWYYQAKFGLLRRTLQTSGSLQPGATLADLGCGLGVFLTLLERHHLLAPSEMVGIDPAAENCKESLGGSVPIVTAWPDKLFDVILLMDVLEHIEDDKGALAQACTKLKPGGHVFITVPAFSFMWSHHDEVLGHYRRYTTSLLKKTIETVPELKIDRLHYFYAQILPIAMIVRMLRRNAKGNSSDMKPVPQAVNTLLKTGLSLEERVAAWNKLAGLSVVALCQKAG